MSEAKRLLKLVEIFNPALEAPNRDYFLATIKQLNPEQRQELLEFCEQVNRHHYGQLLGTPEPVLLYHGSPHKDISQNGFKLTQGKRTNMALGIPAEYDVHNLGIFMTDSLPVAHYYGSNRSKYGHDYELYKAYANLDHMLDLTKQAPALLVRLGSQLYSQWSGDKPKKSLSRATLMWLMDQPQFIDAVKNLGYDAIKFKEQVENLKGAGDRAGNTIMILDPKKLIVKSPKNDLIHDLDSLWNYIQTSRGVPRNVGS